MTRNSSYGSSTTPSYTQRSTALAYGADAARSSLRHRLRAATSPARVAASREISFKRDAPRSDDARREILARRDIAPTAGCT